MASACQKKAFQINFSIAFPDSSPSKPLGVIIVNESQLKPHTVGDVMTNFVDNLDRQQGLVVCFEKTGETRSVELDASLVCLYCA